MFRVGDRATYSATDLSSHSECEHRSELELGVLFGKLQRPGQNELDRRMLELRGIEHERRVREYYESSGATVEDIRAGAGEDQRVEAAAATLDAMRRGVTVIYQGVLRHGDWFGKPDFLVRADGKSTLGEFRYEPVDAKLARETRARAVLQLCVYADLLAQVQGELPERIWIVPGGALRPESLRFADFGAYYRRVKDQFVEFVNAETSSSRPYPEPVEHCNVCPWWKRCEERRHTDDHPSLIAGITRRHRERLADEKLTTLAAIGRMGAGVSVPGIRSESLGRIRHQASVQLAGREAGRPVHERLRPDEPTGLVLLPDPAPGDLFLDLEGDAFFGGEGIEYLFGLYSPQITEDYFGPPEVVAPERYQAFWATDRAEERRAFGRSSTPSSSSESVTAGCTSITSGIVRTPR